AWREPRLSASPPAARGWAGPAAELPSVLTTVEATALVRSQLQPSAGGGGEEGWLLHASADSAASVIDRAYAAAFAARAQADRPGRAADASPQRGGRRAADAASPWREAVDWSLDLSGLPPPPRLPSARGPDVSCTESTPRSSGRRASNRSSAGDVVKRGELWGLRREQRIERLRRSNEQRELEECSFCPQMQRRGPAAPRGLVRSASEALASRLCSPSTLGHRRNEEARHSSLLRSMQQLQECTFVPDLSKSASSFEATGGRRPPEARAQRRQAEAEAEASIAEGRPRTNDLAPHMARAQAYVGKSVFDRLAEPQPDLPRAVPEAPAEPPAPAAAPREAVFEFLRRQNCHEEERLRRLEQLEASTAPPLRPDLSDRSRRLALRRARRARSADAGGAECQSPRAASVGPRAGGGGSASEWSFRPEISRSSARMPCRGCAQMSTGDWLRREAPGLDPRRSRPAGAADLRAPARPASRGRPGREPAAAVGRPRQLPGDPAERAERRRAAQRPRAARALRAGAGRVHVPAA
ncbi:unnamed protein product, partial [Prorocentrum cordatum]